jgi:hypothetical protein
MLGPVWPAAATYAEPVEDSTPGGTRHRDDADWRLGQAADVQWIAAGTERTFAVTAAIPPVFESYATVVIPDEPAERDAHDAALLTSLVARSGEQSWWLGYLETGADELVFPDAPRVVLYAGWPYVFALAGSQQAMSWRSNHGMRSWRGALPDVIFPEDHSWLVSHLWDDDWRCVGGPNGLIEALVGDPVLHCRAVQLGEDATPPGFQSR